MRIFWTFFWSFVLVQMVNYIIGAMEGIQNLHFEIASALSLFFAVVILTIGKILPNDPVEQHHH
jgi:hypothetical protein